MIKLKRWLCKLIYGHRPLHPTDSGWVVGSKFRDRFCNRCGAVVRMPIAEDPYLDEYKTEN